MNNFLFCNWCGWFFFLFLLIFFFGLLINFIPWVLWFLLILLLRRDLFCRSYGFSWSEFLIISNFFYLLFLIFQTDIKVCCWFLKLINLSFFRIIDLIQFFLLVLFSQLLSFSSQPHWLILGFIGFILHSLYFLLYLFPHFLSFIFINFFLNFRLLIIKIWLLCIWSLCPLSYLSNLCV